MDRIRRLWIEFEGGVLQGRPVRARRLPPERGPWLRVSVREAALGEGLFLLVKRGQGDLVAGASPTRALLESAHERLGRERYEIINVPVVER